MVKDNVVMSCLNEIHNLDWDEYNNLVYDSISFEYIPKQNLEIQPDQSFEVLELKEEKIIYIPIAKNASTSIINSLNFTPIKFSIPQNSRCCIDLQHLDIPEKYKNEYKFFTITREPRQRWRSGINEFLNSPHYKASFDGDEKESRSKFLTELESNKFIFDFHTVPQLPWTSFCFKNNLDVTFFKLDENLSEKISSILKRDVTITHDNAMQHYTDKVKNYKFCYDLLTRYCMRNKKFLELYKMDSYLYNNSL